MRDSRNKRGLAFFGLLEALDKIQIVDKTAPLIWLDEHKANRILFIRRLPVRFAKRIPKTIPKNIVLTWKWKKRYPPYNEYDWAGYSRLFAGSFLDEAQRNTLFSILEIDKSEAATPLASDLDSTSDTPQKILMETYRVLRDTALARQIKEIHNYICQVCGIAPIQLSNGNYYAEAHHLMPLGKHRGPDIVENIICVCPNCHVKVDYGVISLQIDRLQTHKTHIIDNKFVEYHNKEILNKITH